MSIFGERCFIPRVPFFHLSKSQVDEPTSRFPNGTFIEIDDRLQSLSYLFFWVTSEGALSPGSFQRALIERGAPHPEPL